MMPDCTPTAATAWLEYKKSNVVASLPLVPNVLPATDGTLNVNEYRVGVVDNVTA
jgi:hypothetical protein